MLRFIDSHCHLDFNQLNRILPHILANAKAQGVEEFVVPSVTAKNLAAVNQLSNQYTFIHSAFGLHPCFMEAHEPGHIDTLITYLEKHQPCAVGEIGLDFFITQDSQLRANQLQLFKQQLMLAKQFSLPVILHVRKAHDQVLNCLKMIKFNEGGIVHAFNASRVQADRYINEFQFKLGFGGALTHARATKLRQLASSLPLESLVLETDAPDMPIANMKESYNQPANIGLIAQVLFELREEPKEVIAQQLWLNTYESLRLKSF
jgi:TatD DNase family protein